MAIQDYKVSEAYSGRDIASLSDRPNQDGMTATQLKARFDQLGKEVIPNYNDLIDFIKTNLFSGTSTNDHTHNVDNLEDGTVNRNYTQTDKTKLDGIATGAEVNQNAFSNVKVGSSTIPSTTKTDTIELVAGLNITMTVDVATKKVFLSATGDLATQAVQSLILDINNYYEALNVEDALQELGAVINGLLRSEAYFGFDSNQQTVTLNFQDGTSLNLGSELWYAQGKAVGYIASGDNVMLAGSQGDHYLVKKAVASELALNPQLYLGVATKGSANNEWVKITRWGLVNDVNTNGWTYGTKLYFDPVTLGFTPTLPSLPNARIEVGMVVRQHASSGIILVLPYTLNLYTNSEIDAMFSAKQPTLVSGTNIKTINGNSVLGSGDVELLPKNNPTATGTQTFPSIVTNGIKFPATQVPSADPNTLDDYEKGTFTPNVTFATTTGTITYTSQQGKYVKIGGLVTVFFKVSFSQTGSSGFIKLGGLPFFVDGTPSASGATYISGLDSVTGTPIARADNGQTFAYLYQIINGDATPIGASNVASVDIEFTMSYWAS